MPPTIARLSRARSREGRRRKGSKSWIFHNAFHARRRSKTRRLLRNKKPRCAGLLQEPSDGLEPSTPSYHGGFGASRAYTRSSAAQFRLEISMSGPRKHASRDVARVVSDVSVLCPRVVDG